MDENFPFGWKKGKQKMKMKMKWMKNVGCWMMLHPNYGSNHLQMDELKNK